MDDKGINLARNSTYNVAYKFIAAVYSFFTICYVPRILCAENLGKVNYVFAIVFFFVQIASLGIPNYGVKCIAQASSQEERNKIFNELFKINLISTTIFLALYILLINTVFYSETHYKLMILMTISIILNYFNTDWYFQGVEQYKYLSIRSIIIKIIEILAILLFVNNEDHYFRYAIILCLNTVIDYVFNMIPLRKTIKFGIFKSKVKEHLKPVIILCLSTIAMEVYTTIDTVMLEKTCGDSYVGYYSVGMKLIRYIYLIIIAIVVPFFPYFSSLISKEESLKLNKIINTGFSIIMTLAIPAVIIMVLMADWMVPIIFGQSYMPTIDVVYILSILIPTFSLAYFLGHLLLISTGNEKRILVATLCGMIINVILNSMLIPKYAHIGACLASVISEVIVTIILIQKSCQYFDLKIIKKQVISIITSTIVMILMLAILKHFISPSLISLLIVVAIVIILYLFLLKITNNKLIIELTRIIKKND